MAVISIKDVHEGMEVEVAVTNLQGDAIAKPGAILTRKLLKAFKAWGVTEVTVRGPHDVPDSEISAPEGSPGHPDFENEVDAIFLKNDRDDPVIQELHRLALERRANEQGAYLGESKDPRG